MDTDLDGDGVKNELSRADVTAVTLWQATLQVPGRVIPRDPAIENAVWKGEQLFESIGCAECHIPRLPLDRRGWIYEEPNPFNPSTNLRKGDAGDLRGDLTSDRLPAPRLKPDSASPNVVWIPAYTDFKLHDITSGPDDPNSEPLDMNFGTWAVNFGKGNRKFITKRLWGCANEPPFFHHGLFTTLREAVLAHAGEALASRKSFEALSPGSRDAVIEFLEVCRFSLQERLRWSWTGSSSRESGLPIQEPLPVMVIRDSSLFQRLLGNSRRALSSATARTQRPCE